MTSTPTVSRYQYKTRRTKNRSSRKWQSKSDKIRAFLAAGIMFCKRRACLRLYGMVRNKETIRRMAVRLQKACRTGPYDCIEATTAVTNAALLSYSAEQLTGAKRKAPRRTPRQNREQSRKPQLEQKHLLPLKSNATQSFSMGHLHRSSISVSC